MSRSPTIIDLALTVLVVGAVLFAAVRAVGLP